MRSLYKRQLTMMVGVMVLSFTLLSTAFMLLSYRYIISEKRDAMARNASYIATFTASYYQQYDSIQDKIYSNYVASIARISDSYVIVTTPGGEIIYATDGDHLYDYKNTGLPKAMVDQVLHDGDYTGMTNLDGIYPERRYMAALPVSAMTLSGRTVVEGLVLVSRPPESLAGGSSTCGSPAMRADATRSAPWLSPSIPWQAPWPRWRVSGRISSPMCPTS